MNYFKKRKKEIIQGALFFIGVIITALGSVYMIKASSLGVQPFDVLYIGIHHHSGVSIGQVSILLGISLLLISYWISKEKLKVGTILDAILLGTFVDFFLSTEFIVTPETILSKVIYFVLGTICIALGASMTIYSNIGTGPIDTFILTLHKKFNMSFKLTATIIEISAVFIGFILGGPIGIATLLFCLALGPLMELFLKLLDQHGSIVFGEVKL